MIVLHLQGVHLISLLSLSFCLFFSFSNSMPIYKHQLCLRQGGGQEVQQVLRQTGRGKEAREGGGQEERDEKKGD